MGDQVTSRLPIKLGQEPLIDALFEVRFSSSVAASSILPGFLYSKLDGITTIEELPSAQLPKALRDSDPSLQYAPVSRLDWGAFAISISDRSVVIGCKYPYPGWTSFKPAIIEVMTILSKIGIIQSVQRYSMKYVDLLPSSDLKQQISFINLKVTIAGHKLDKETFQIRIEVLRDGFINAIQVVTSATVVSPDGAMKSGVIVDVDTIDNLNGVAVPFKEFLEDFSVKLEAIPLLSG